jgi:hypothetical protein
MSGGARRANWHKWAGRIAPEPTAGDAPLPMPAAAKLDAHLAAAIDEFSVSKEKGTMSDTENQQPQPDSAAPNAAAEPGPATPLPPAPTITLTAPLARRPAGSFAASIRAMMDEAREGVQQARADGLAVVQSAVNELGEAKAATVKVAGQMAKTIRDEASDVMAELGQISNDL